MYENSQNQNPSVVKSFFARTSFLTLTISSAVFTLFLLFQTLATSFSFSKNDILVSIYYFFGDSDTSILISNLIIGVLVLFAFAMLTFSMISCYLGAKKNNDDQIHSGINGTLYALIYMVILAGFLTVISFASISVTYYKTYLDTNHSGASDAPIRFFISVIFSAGIITLIIALIRLVLSIRRNFNGDTTTTVKGAVLALISGIYCSAITGIAFIVNLANLVLPYRYISENKSFEPSEVLVLTIAVLVSAVMTIILIDTSLLVSIYSSAVNRINRKNTETYYSYYSTNMYNQNFNRTPYTNPVPPQAPSPMAKPYTEQSHQQYVERTEKQFAPQTENEPDSSFENEKPQENSIDESKNTDKE